MRKFNCIIILAKLLPPEIVQMAEALLWYTFSN